MKKIFLLIFITFCNITYGQQKVAKKTNTTSTLSKVVANNIKPIGINFLSSIPSGGFNIRNFNEYKSLVKLENRLIVDSLTNTIDIDDNGSLNIFWNQSDYSFSGGIEWVENYFDISGGFETIVTFQAKKRIRNSSLIINGFNFYSISDDGFKKPVMDLKASNVPELETLKASFYYEITKTGKSYLVIPDIFDGQKHQIKIRKFNKVPDKNIFFSGTALFIDNMVQPYCVGQITGLRSNINFLSTLSTESNDLQYTPHIKFNINSEELDPTNTISVTEWSFACFCNSTPTVSNIYSNYVEIDSKKYSIPNFSRNKDFFVEGSLEKEGSKLYNKDSPYDLGQSYGFVEDFRTAYNLNDNKSVLIVLSLMGPLKGNLRAQSQFKILEAGNRLSPENRGYSATVNISIEKRGITLESYSSKSGEIAMVDVIRYDGRKGKEIDISNIQFQRASIPSIIIPAITGKFYLWEPIELLTSESKIDTSKLCLFDKDIKPITESISEKYKRMAIDNLSSYNPPNTPANLAKTCSYAKMYLSNPKLFKWAGLAALVSGKVGHESESVLAKLSDLVGFDLNKVVLDGNEKVYLDLYWQHLLAKQEGIEGIKKAYLEKAITQQSYEGWLNILSHTTDDDIWNGNKKLLYYEQSEILQPLIYDTYPTAWTIITNVYVSRKMYLTTPIPPGEDLLFKNKLLISLKSVGDLKDRWELIESEILPAWRKFESNPENIPLLISSYQKVCPNL